MAVSPDQEAELDQILNDIEKDLDRLDAKHKAETARCKRQGGSEKFNRKIVAKTKQALKALYEEMPVQDSAVVEDDSAELLREEIMRRVEQSEKIKRSTKFFDRMPTKDINGKLEAESA